jgi:GNAT superfamily N-acetyltransferase
MELFARSAPVEAITRWRDLYRQEMNCQIVHDSLHSRPDWTRTYLLSVGEVIAGYGAIAVGGPWKEKPALFEFYVAPRRRASLFDLFAVLVRASGVRFMEGQSNDPLFSVMLHTFGSEITNESILFHDKLTTALSLPGAALSRVVPEDALAIAEHKLDGTAEWKLRFEGTAAATGGILFHYNRPYGDIYMQVAEKYRKRGLGAFFVQELKRVCYEGGSVPAARCNPGNLASRKTLQKAGFVPCGNILTAGISL